jgi:hypothetical protein
MVDKQYWWDGRSDERFWLEIRHRKGIGTELRCPLKNTEGRSNPWYDLVAEVGKGDVIYHWHAKERRFLGRSVAAANPIVDSGERAVELKGFTALATVVDRSYVLSKWKRIEQLHHELEKAWPGKTLYMPFQFRADGLRMMSNYFTKFPSALVPILFGATGIADQELASPTGAAEAVSKGPSMPDAKPAFLQPFKPKADAEYVAHIAPRVEKRTRRHETLVNDFVEWAEARSIQVRRNQAIDIALGDPPVVVEAKMLPEHTHSGPIREAIGQLYEYRYFRIVSPKAKLILLVSRPLPSNWVKYLEEDRGIGVAWPHDGGFRLSRMATEAVGV